MDRVEEGADRCRRPWLLPRGEQRWWAVVRLLVLAALVGLSGWHLLGRRSAATAAGGGNATDGATVRVAVVQFISEMGNPDVNRQRLATYVRQAASNGAKIVVLPEAAIPGYLSEDLATTWHVGEREVSNGLRGLPPDAVAETVPGPSTRIFGALARELAIYLTVPIIEMEPETGRFFNTLVLMGPKGELLLHYRKLTPWPFAEQGWASEGDRGHQYVDTPYGRLALLICYDINFEPPRLKGLNVDTLLYSIAWVDRPESDWFEVRLPQIARENGLNIVGANWTVSEKPAWHGYGQSLIIERTGRVLARAGRDIGEEIIYAELPLPGEQGSD